MAAEGWIVTEYDRRIPRALIEYKHRNARVRLDDSNNVALRNLADMAGLPMFVVVYDRSAYYGVVPCNDRARVLCPHRTVMDEPEFIRFQHRIRRARHA